MPVSSTRWHDLSTEQLTALVVKIYIILILYIRMNHDSNPESNRPSLPSPPSTSEHIPSTSKLIYCYLYHRRIDLPSVLTYPTNVRSVPETSFSQPELWRVLRLQFMSDLKTPKIWMGLVEVGWSLIHLDGWKFSSLMQKLIIFYGGLWQEFYHPVDSRPRTTFLMSLPSTCHPRQPILHTRTFPFRSELE